jgi:hypothetical protein
MASGTNFKLYDPVAQLVATGGGSGGGLPLTGGTLTGNLILQVPAKVVQSQPPVNPSDLANKQYVDSLIGGGPFLPLIGGTLTGNVVLTSPSKIQQNQAPTVGDDLTNKTYVDSKVNTPNSIPGASIQNGTVTNTQLALGAAASNINADPPGSINASQIAGGPFLPLTGGTMSGQITQSLAPVVGTDLANKTYIDGNFQAKKPAAVPNNIALFGSGADTGQTIDSTYNIDINLANPPSNNTLWPSSRLIGALQYGANVYKSTTSISLGGSANVKAFSTGNAIMGPSGWPNIGSTFSLAPTGIATISNSLEYTTYYRIIFSANSLSESTNAFGSVECKIQDEAGPSFITIPKILNCLASPPAFSNEVYLSCLVSIPPISSFNFSVIMTNLGFDSVTIDPIAPSNACILVIERVA